MIKSGLVSVTFRHLSPKEIIDLVVEAKLDGIEWGGDIHVPHGDIAKAKEVCQLTTNAGLNIAAYGSYYKVGESEQNGLAFTNVLQSAIALTAPVIRVWAGKLPSSEANTAYRQGIIEDARRIADLANAEKIKIAFEYHSNTLTDTNESAKQLLGSVNHENIYSYWQPIINKDFEYNKSGLAQAVGHKLQNIHVYHWVQKGDTRVMKALKQGYEEWKQYSDIADKIPGIHYAMLEFVENNLPENFLRDACTLKDIIK